MDNLNVSLIVVLGHDHCGAVKAAIAGPDAPGHIGSITCAIQPAVTKAKQETGDLLENAINENVLQSVEQIKTSTPILAAAVKAGKLTIVVALQPGARHRRVAEQAMTTGRLCPAAPRGAVSIPLVSENSGLSHLWPAARAYGLRCAGSSGGFRGVPLHLGGDERFQPREIPPKSVPVISLLPFGDQGPTYPVASRRGRAPNV